LIAGTRLELWPKIILQVAILLMKNITESIKPFNRPTMLFQTETISFSRQRLHYLKVHIPKLTFLQKINSVRQWDLLEVKQSIDVKNYHLDDIALQRYAFANVG
jgi:hypothetical protein